MVFLKDSICIIGLIDDYIQTILALTLYISQHKLPWIDGNLGRSCKIFFNDVSSTRDTFLPRDTHLQRILWRPNFLGLTLDRYRYDDTTDSDEHIEVYVTQYGLYTSDDTVFCKVFFTSLKEATLS